MIDLFFRDVERAKADPSFLSDNNTHKGILDTFAAVPGQAWGGVKNVAVNVGSFFGNVFNSIKSGVSSVGSFIGGLFTNDNGLTDAGSVDLASSNASDSGGGTVNTVSPKTATSATKKDALAKKNAEIAALKLQIAGLQTDARAQDKAVLQLEKGQPDIVVADISTTSVEHAKAVAPKNVSVSAPFCSYTADNGMRERSIVVNEIAWMGGVRSASDEWIELKNVSGSDINVSGWQLVNKGGGIKIHFDGLKNPVIKPGQFILLERTDNNSAVGATADLIYSGALANGNEGLKLFNASCGVVDEVTVAPKWSAGDNATKQTMERDSNGSGWHTSAAAGGTPKKENSAGVAYFNGGGGSVVTSAQTGVGGDSITPRTYSTLLISEVQLASASSTHDEFITLYNPNSTAVDLTGWYVQKKTKTAADFSSFAKAELFAGRQIAAQGFLTIAHPSSSVAYAIASDYGIADDNTFTIKNPNGDIADKVGWGNAGDCEGSCAVNPSAGERIKRKYVQGAMIDTNNNAQDFELLVAAQNTVGIADAATTPTSATPSQIAKDDLSGSLSVLSYYQSLATNTAYTIGSFSIYGSGIAGKWKGGVCEFSRASFQCANVLAQSFADTDMPGGDGDTLLTFNFPAPVMLDKGGSYALFVDPTGEVPAPARISRVRGSVTDTYLGGALSAFGQYTSVYINELVDPGLADMYFETSATTSTRDALVSGISATTTATTTVTATTSQFYPIVINEIMYDLPGADDGREWIELYNNGTTSVDIATWRLNEGGTNHLLTIKEGTSTLPIGGYAVVANDSAKFLTDNSGFSGALFDSAFSLSNEGEPIALKNGDLVIDTVAYASSAGANGDGRSLQTFADGWHAASSTPGMVNVLPVVIVAEQATTTFAEIATSTTATSTPAAPTHVGQMIDSVQSTIYPALYYIQGIGKNVTNEIRTVHAFVESDELAPWSLSICKIPDGYYSKCLNNLIASVNSGQPISATGTKTLVSFTFVTPVSLEPDTEYALSLRPVMGPIPPQSSVYGSATDAYPGGQFGNMVRGYYNEPLAPGIADMYFEINK